jgi:hypothetical protein
MLNPDLETRLSLLDYTVEWVKAGILTESTSENQLQEFATGEDANKEHYRYRTMMTYLKSHDPLTDIQLEQITGLLRNDQDKSMASSVLISLSKRKTLTDIQFNLVSKMLLEFGNRNEKYINNQSQVREIEKGSNK